MLTPKFGGQLGDDNPIIKTIPVGKRKLTPVAGLMGVVLQVAMVSLRAGFSPLFLCLRASRSVLAPPLKLRPKIVVRQDGGASS